ncbi:MAG: hypothetical protein BV459_06685 [Thermoplasmata archaeon M11B2D]|nr:MAG: hypothetical protein BV459_06685 [Thermoplasmata archaeon M11B2D]PNX51203.1 MAG: hypothetical protein BV458_11855 [Thermoplasmata archaeon M9B2D]
MATKTIRVVAMSDNGKTFEMTMTDVEVANGEEFKIFVDDKLIFESARVFDLTRMAKQIGEAISNFKIVVRRE